MMRFFSGCILAFALNLAEEDDRMGGGKMKGMSCVQGKGVQQEAGSVELNWGHGT